MERINRFVVAVTVVALGSLALLVRATGPFRLTTEVLPLALIAGLFSYFPVRLGRESHVDFVMPFALAFITIYGPWVGIVGVLMGVAVAEFLLHRSRWQRVLFNFSLVAIETSAASLILILMYGTASQRLDIFLLITLATMALVDWLTNVVVFSGLAALLAGTPYLTQLWGFIKTVGRHLPVDTVAAVLFVSVYQSMGSAGLIFIAAILLFVRYGFQAYYQLQASYEEVQSMLISILDARDSYTAGHSSRVAENAAKLATELKLQPKEIENIRRAGLLHDIGKVNVPDYILQKPGKLDEEETRKMNQHPVDGARFVEGVSSLKHLAPIIRHHHERYDGKGYPDGISGEAIPLGARVLSVADAFDAMTTDRPYRRALTKVQALQQLLEHAGTQFDEKVALAAVKVLGPGLEDYPQLRSLADAVRIQLAAAREQQPEGRA